MKKRAFFRVVLILFACLSLTTIRLPFVHANGIPTFSLKMPQEYINYTIYKVDQTLWTKVDDTYPLTKVELGSLNQTDTTVYSLATFTGESLQMVYPTPPGTTNISVTIDDTELSWSNYTQTHPDATHATPIGDWPMISCLIEEVPDEFTLKIHYEHPIQQIDGNNSFVYDINISPYLFSWSNKSTAYFTLRFETPAPELQITTVTAEGTESTPTFETVEDDGVQTVTLEIVSEYLKPLHGDLVVTFSDQQESFSRELAAEEIVLITVILVGSVAVSLYIIIKRRKQKKPTCKKACEPNKKQ
jgi:hypothetical protein